MDLVDYTIRREPIAEAMPEIGELFRAVYPEAGHRLPRLQRKYLENPAGEAMPWVARIKSDGKLAACAMAMPWMLVIGDQTRRCVQVGDLMVHPEHRRKGLSLGIFGSGFQGLRKIDAELIFAFVRTGGASHGGALKFGAKPIDEMRSLKRLVLPSYLGRKWLGKSQGQSGLDLRWRRGFERKAGELARYSIEKVERLDESIQSVFFRHHDGQTISSLRSAAYLNWRHGGVDERRLLLALRKDGALEGYAALTFLHAEGVNLVDFYPWQPGVEAREALFAHLLVWLSARGIKLLQIVAPTSLRKALRGKRLIDRGPSWSLVGYDLRGGERPEGFWNKAGWMLAPGDCDVGPF